MKEISLLLMSFSVLSEAWESRKMLLDISKGRNRNYFGYINAILYSLSEDRKKKFFNDDGGHIGTKVQRF